MITNDREYRAFEMRAANEDEYTVEGYAAVVNTPTVLFTDGDTEYKEQIAPDAFEGAQMSDVVMNFDHEGKPVARTKNNTLDLSVDATGLKVKAFLGEAGKGESDRYRVSWTSSERRSFDSKRFAKENPDIDMDSYYKVSTYRTFKVTEKKEEK